MIKLKQMRPSAHPTTASPPLLDQTRRIPRARQLPRPRAWNRFILSLLLHVAYIPIKYSGAQCVNEKEREDVIRMMTIGKNTLHQKTVLPPTFRRLRFVWIELRLVLLRALLGAVSDG